MRAKKRRVSILSKESTRLINEVIACLRIPQNQQLYNQGTWFSRHYVPTANGSRACGTEGCLAGWLVFVGKPRIHSMLEKAAFEKNRRHSAKVFEKYDVQKIAGDLLKLRNGKPASTLNLFIGDGDYWPKPFDNMWQEAGSDRHKQALVAIARLEHYKYTGE